jgi:hypothetical protein
MPKSKKKKDHRKRNEERLKKEKANNRGFRSGVSSVYEDEQKDSSTYHGRNYKRK